MGFPHYSGGSSGIIGSGTLQIGSAADVFLVRDAANALAQRNGTNAQTFRLYETFTDASNYSRLSIAHSTAYFIIAPEAAGTGTQRGLLLRGNGTNDAQIGLVNDEILFGTTAADYWTMSTAGTGHLLAGVDNTRDIGAVGASRPRNLHLGGYLAGSVQSLSGPGAVNLTTQTTAFTSTGAAQALTLADGVVGQMKEIIHVVDGGSGVLTPTNLFNGTTITFTNLGESVILRFIGTEWHVIAINGAVLA